MISNKEFFLEWHKLDPWLKHELRNTFSQSPITIRLIEILDKAKGREIAAEEILEKIYPNQSNFRILENRFYKLRKKIRDAVWNLNHSEKNLPKEESEWLQCQQLLLKNEKSKALEKLLALEKECLKKNIFELLPKISDSIIFLNQSFNISNQQKGLFKKMDQYVEWHQAILEVNSCARKIHENFVKKGFQGIGKDLLRVKKIALKFPSLPRFKLCFNHLNLYYKLASPEHTQKKIGLGRYHNTFLKLYKENPEIPLFNYRLHYKSLQRFHFLQIQTMFYYNRFEIQEALYSMQELWKLVESENEVLGIYKTEPFYFNYASALILNELYNEASRIVRQYVLNADESHKVLADERVCQELFIIYTLKNTRKNPPPLTTEEKKGLVLCQSSSSEKNGLNQYIRNQLALMRWNLLKGNLSGALAIQNKNDVQGNLRKIQIGNIFNILNNSNKEERQKQFRLQLNNPKHPEQFVMSNWLMKAEIDS